MRQPIVAGNWKMHRIAGEAVELARAVASGVEGRAAEVVLCPPFTALDAVGRTIDRSPVVLGAQNVHWEPEGAFTGEISVPMLQAHGCRYVIVGHSERRALFGETDEQVQRKARAVLAAGLRPIVCVGETLEEREGGRTEAVVQGQIEGSLAGLGPDLLQVVIAYEPVWAIGTGRTATAEQAQSVHRFIRGLLAGLAGDEAADCVRIQYGGSLKPQNAREILGQPDVDGGLVGGASLDPDAFVAIVDAAV